MFEKNGYRQYACKMVIHEITVETMNVYKMPVKRLYLKCL